MLEVRLAGPLKIFNNSPAEETVSKKPRVFLGMQSLRRVDLINSIHTGPLLSDETLFACLYLATIKVTPIFPSKIISLWKSSSDQISEMMKWAGKSEFS